jgi:hypothetical protein
MRVRADVVESEETFAGVADHDLASGDDARPHASLRNLGQCHYRRESLVGHE